MRQRAQPQSIVLRIAFLIALGCGMCQVYAAGPVTPQGPVAQLLSSLITTHSAASSASAPSTSSSPTIGALVNGASFLPGVAPGSLITLFISNAPVYFTISADSAPLPIGLGGATVSINGTLAPLLYASTTQINAQLPYEATLGDATATLTIGTTTGSAFPFTIVTAAPGIFIYGANRAVAQNQDYSLNTSGNPASVGSYITVYLTGGGALDNPVATGAPTPSSPLSQVTAPFSATLDGQSALVSFLGLTPTFVALLQANIQIPAGLAPGDHALVITIGGNSSNAPLITTN